MGDSKRGQADVEPGLSPGAMTHAEAVAWAQARGSDLPERGAAMHGTHWTKDPSFACIEGHLVCVNGHGLKDASFPARAVPRGNPNFA